VQKESQLVIDFFASDADLRLIHFRTPLCFESIRDYFHTMTRGVYKKHGSDIGRFREGLRVVAKELIDIMAASTSRIVKHADLLLRDGTPKKVLVYGYSRSIALTLKRLAKSLEDNLTVLVCRSGCLEEGAKLYEELTLEGVRCKLIGDN
jgi:translation initiation factor 2B subunit (eIF-2B alpha/beta/delta family)